MRTRAILLVVAALAASCGHAALVRDQAQTVPWVAASPTPEQPVYASPASNDVPACLPTDLDMTVFLGGAAGSLAGDIGFKNTSSHPCALSGRPSVKILDAANDEIPVAFQADGPEFEAGFQPPGWPNVYLRPGDNAAAPVFFAEWCTPRKPARWSVDLPSVGGVFTSPETTTPPCHSEDLSASSKPLLAVRPAQPVPLETTPITYPFSISITAPATATQGADLHYTVTLTNTSQNAFRFHRCPVYDESVSAPGTKAAAAYFLNCAGVGEIASGGSVTFQMVLDRWFAARTGEGGLYWGFQSPDGPTAHVAIAVLGA